jgi:hypothetical protein
VGRECQRNRCKARRYLANHGVILESRPARALKIDHRDGSPIFLADKKRLVVRRYIGVNGTAAAADRADNSVCVAFHQFSGINK